MNILEEILRKMGALDVSISEDTINFIYDNKMVQITALPTNDSAAYLIFSTENIRIT